MDEKHRTLLRDHTRYLVDSLDFKDTMLADNLVQNKVLTPDGKEQLETYKVKGKMASEFVNHVLPRRGPKAFEMFIKSLMETEGQQFIAEKLCPVLAQKYGSCAGLVVNGEPSVSTSVQPEQSEEDIVAHLSNSGSAFEKSQTVTRQTVEKLLREGAAYKLVRNKRGRAVIINNEIFHDRALTREGAKEDLKDLKNLFQHLMFDVQAYENKTGKELEDIVIAESEFDHSQYDAFVLFVLSHGEAGHVIGTDGCRVKVDDLVTRIGGCRTLIHKPKILLFQCCRNDPADTSSRTRTAAMETGTRYDGMRLLRQFARAEHDRTDADPIFSSDSDLGSNPDPDLGDVGDAGAACVANCMDIFVAYSTLPGFSAIRNTCTGSWFVRFFVYVCCTRGHEKDLESMTKDVNRLLMIKLKEQQVCETYGKGLLRKIYFFPGYEQTF